MSKYDWELFHLKEKVLERDKGCVWCGVSLDRFTVTADHLIPKSKGGETALENIGACCRGCNGEKGDRTPLEYINYRLDKEVRM